MLGGSRKKKRKAPAGESTAAGSTPKEPGTTTSPPRKEAVRTLVKRGYARQGDLVATLEQAVFGRDGKNVLGEVIHAKKVYVPRLVAGMNVVVEKGSRYVTRVSGLVEVSKDERGTFFIKSKLYRQGRCTVAVSDDEMQATLSLSPPVGGALGVSTEQVLEECGRLGITHGLDRRSIEEAVNRTADGGDSVENMIIARGEPPVNGENGSITFHVVRASGSAVKQRGDGSVDFKNLDRVTSVREDQLIAVMKRETAGKKDGRTVTGQVRKAQNGRPVKLEVGANIRTDDKGTGVEYHSKINGQLFTDGKKISVEPVLVIEGDVGPKTGNIKFSGTVHVTGSVLDTYNVFSKKDIIVEGSVGNCVVKTDGSLTVLSGITGKNKGKVLVQGDVTAKFAENSNIEAGGSIFIQRAALNCRLTAGSRVVAVEEKGQIVGGEIRATEGVEVKILGNDSEHRMEVKVGSNFSVEGKIAELQNKIQSYDRALKKIALILDKLKRVAPEPDRLPENLRKVYEETRKKGTVAKIAISELQKRQSQLSARLDEIRDAEIVVRESLFRGVRISFGRTAYETESTESNIRISYNRDGQRIEVERMV
jgi:uncharacterized protein (DUF342 family)